MRTNSNLQVNDFIADPVALKRPSADDAPARDRAATHDHVTINHKDGKPIQSRKFLRGARKQFAAMTGMHHTFN